MFFPLALPLTKRSTLSTVRLYADTWNPLLSMLRMRFSPITAMPITPISDFSCISFLLFCSQSYTFTCRKKTKREKCCSFLMITANEKLNRKRKDMKMNTKNSIVTYALVGLAAGTAAWLLLGTKEGRKQMARASDGIRELSKSIRKTTKEGIRRASDIANRATEEIDNFRSQAKDKSQAAMQQADRMAQSGVDQARRTVKAAKRKAEEEI